MVGEEFIRSNEPIIRAVRYHFDNVASLLSGHKTFQSLSPDPDDVRRLLKKDHERSEKIADKYGWPKRSFEPEIGEHPYLMYFSGVWEIIASETSLEGSR
ncbi:hypothetical protein ACD589_00475 [Rhizobium sp. 814_E9_N1_1]|uniref:hypothetical protein n=1 Tax=unclassified Rhizobium TaxID=2613769 RepID=UPI003F22876D